MLIGAQGYIGINSGFICVSYILACALYSRVGRTLVGDEWGNYVNTRELCKAAKSVSDISKLLDQEPSLQQIKVARCH